MFDQQMSTRKVNLDISPLLDVVFLLLIFFLVTTTFLPDAGMDLELPESTTAAPSDLTSTVVSVDEDGAIQFDGDSVSVEELRAAIAALTDEERERITVRADSRVDYGVIVRVIDALRIAGVAGVSLPMEAVEGDAAGRRGGRGPAPR